VVSDLAIPGRDRLLPADMVIRTTLGAGQPLLRRSQSICRGAAPARIVHTVPSLSVA